MKLRRVRNLRTRLIAWHVSVLAAILLVYSGGLLTLFFFGLRGQLEQHAIEQLESVKGHLYFLPDGRLNLRTDYHDHAYPSSEQERFLEVLMEDGSIAFRNEPLGDRALGGPPGPGEGVDSYSPRSVRLAGGPRVRLISKKCPVEGRPLLIRLALSEESLWRSLLQAFQGLLVGLPAALALAAWGGSAVTRRALRPMDDLARRAREINAEELKARLPVENPQDEVGILASAFNDMLARLETSFAHLRRFTADAAHELRTPLTAIRSVGEVGLRRRDGPAVYREVIESMLEEAERLQRLVDGLILMARADAGQMPLQRTEWRALELTREVAGLLEVLAEENRQMMLVEGDETVQVYADRTVVRQILMNIIDNAIKYTPAGGTIQIRVRQGGGHAVLFEVEDNGPGIAPEHRERIFDRFYRTDDARSRATGGAGLGLAIARWGARAHGGRLELVSPAGGGCLFRLTLPLGPARPASTAQRTA